MNGLLWRQVLEQPLLFIDRRFDIIDSFLNFLKETVQIVEALVELVRLLSRVLLDDSFYFELGLSEPSCSLFDLVQERLQLLGLVFAAVVEHSQEFLLEATKVVGGVVSPKHVELHVKFLELLTELQSHLLLESAPEILVPLNSLSLTLKNGLSHITVLLGERGKIVVHGLVHVGQQRLLESVLSLGGKLYFSGQLAHLVLHLHHGLAYLVKRRLERVLDDACHFLLLLDVGLVESVSNLVVVR